MEIANNKTSAIENAHSIKIEEIAKLLDVNLQRG